MKALIIGAAGFVGHYLISHLRDACNWQVSATKLKHEEVPGQGISLFDLDILEIGQIRTLLEQVRPDCIFHLAAQSSVALSWKNPALTADVNIKGVINLLDAARALDYRPRILLIGSGEEYGHVKPEEIPIREENNLRPGNIYAATKACQNMIGKIYADAYGMDIIRVRAFNHIAPGQAPIFVVSDFCKQVAEIEAGIREPVISVGNLSAKRDFTDVRDVVRAYQLLMENGRPGELYNVGSGHAVAIQEILDQILSLSNQKIEVRVDSSRMRPVDVPIIEADISKLCADTGWERQIALEQTIREIVEDWRNKVKAG